MYFLYKLKWALHYCLSSHCTKTVSWYRGSFKNECMHLLKIDLNRNGLDILELSLWIVLRLTRFYRTQKWWCQTTWRWSLYLNEKLWIDRSLWNWPTLWWYCVSSHIEVCPWPLHRKCNQKLYCQINIWTKPRRYTYRKHR